MQNLVSIDKLGKIIGNTSTASFRRFSKSIGIDPVEVIRVATKGRPLDDYLITESDAAYLIVCAKSTNNDIKKWVSENGHRNFLEYLRTIETPEKKGFVYIVKFNDLIKIGVSVKPEKRVRSLETQQGRNNQAVIVLGSFSDYRNIEKAIHRELEISRTEGEYFNCSYYDALLAASKVLEKDIYDFALLFLKDTKVESIKTLIELGFPNSEIERIIAINEDLGEWSGNPQCND